MYIRKSTGPKTEHCTTPRNTSTQLETLLLAFYHYMVPFFDIYFPDTIFKVHNRYNLFNKISI
jgi:hypothetical protein